MDITRFAIKLFMYNSGTIQNNACLMIPSSLYIKVYKKLSEVMIKSITNFLFQQLKSQISKIDQNGYNPFCDETLHV